MLYLESYDYKRNVFKCFDDRLQSYEYESLPNEIRFRQSLTSEVFFVWCIQPEFLLNSKEDILRCNIRHIKNMLSGVKDYRLVEVDDELQFQNNSGTSLCIPPQYVLVDKNGLVPTYAYVSRFKLKELGRLTFEVELLRNTDSIFGGTVRGKYQNMYQSDGLFYDCDTNEWLFSYSNQVVDLKHLLLMKLTRDNLYI